MRQSTFSQWNLHTVATELGWSHYLFCSISKFCRLCHQISSLRLLSSNRNWRYVFLILCLRCLKRWEGFFFQRWFDKIWGKQPSVVNAQTLLGHIIKDYPYQEIKCFISFIRKSTNTSCWNLNENKGYCLPKCCLFSLSASNTEI